MCIVLKNFLKKVKTKKTRGGNTMKKLDLTKINRPLNPVAKTNYREGMEKSEAVILPYSNSYVTPVISTDGSWVKFESLADKDDQVIVVREFNVFGNTIKLNVIESHYIVEDSRNPKGYSKMPVYILPEMDGEIIAKSMKDFYDLAGLLVGMEMQFKILTPDYQKLTNVLTHEDGSPMVGDSLGLAYFNMPISSDPAVKQEALNTADTKRYSQAAKRYALEASASTWGVIAAAVKGNYNNVDANKLSNIGVDNFVVSENNFQNSGVSVGSVYTPGPEFKESKPAFESLVNAGGVNKTPLGGLGQPQATSGPMKIKK